MPKRQRRVRQGQPRRSSGVCHSGSNSAERDDIMNTDTETNHLDRWPEKSTMTHSTDFLTNNYLRLAPEVRDALEDGRPGVALESTVIAHGLPRPTNLAVAREL